MQQEFHDVDLTALGGDTQRRGTRQRIVGPRAPLIDIRLPIDQ
jgi:hypothetical protein